MVDLPHYWDTFEKRLDYILRARGMSNKEFSDLVDPEGGQQIVHNWRKRGRIGWPSQQKVREILGGPRHRVAQHRQGRAADDAR
ncbi:hypothetical protein [Lysobacter sp. HA35]